MQSGYEKKTERRPNDLEPCALVISDLQAQRDLCDEYNSSNLTAVTGSELRPFNVYIATHQQGVGPA